MTAALEARGIVVVAGGRTILDVPGLEVAEGEVLALLGPNGAGKTTLINTLALLARPRSGEVLVKGERPGRSPVTLRRRMAVVFQSPHLLSATVARNVAAGLAFRGAREPGPRVEAALGRFGISHLRDRHARSLSGGEAARVCLARAFVLDPEILLMDEPLSSLDAPTRAALLDDLETAMGQGRAATVFSTHDASEAVRLATRVAVILGGRIAQIGPAREVMDRPCSREVARLVGMDNVLEGVVSSRSGGDASVSIDGVEIAARTSLDAGARVLCMIRPEHVRLVGGGGAAGGLGGTVSRVIPSANHVRIAIDCGFALSAILPAVPAGLGPGSAVRVEIDPARVHLIGRVS